MAVPGILRRRLVVAAVVVTGVLVLGGLWIRHSVMLVKRDVSSAQQSLVAASRSDAGSVGDRAALVTRARASLDAADRSLRRAPLGVLGSLPLLGRDVRVARAIVQGSRDATATAEQLLDGLTEVDPAANSDVASRVTAMSTALERIQRTLHDARERVKRTAPLFASRERATFLAGTATLEERAANGGRAANIVAELYRPNGSVHYLLAFQNPAELRGTGGLIGLYGILRAGRAGPILDHVESTETLGGGVRPSVRTPPDAAAWYQPFGFGGDWRDVNIPADLPTTSRVILDLYQRTRGTRPDGVIVADPLAAAQILRVVGPIVVGGQRLDARSLPHALMVDAYVRYQANAELRKKFLASVARRVIQVLGPAAARQPIEAIRALAAALRGRHLQMYSADPEKEAGLERLGVAGTGTAPAFGDYLMPIGINASGNKLDVFLDRHIRYAVQLDTDGGARTEASITLHNRAPKRGLPPTVIGPYDRRFQAGENRQFQQLYVAADYGLGRASQSGRHTAVYAVRSVAGLMLGKNVSIPAHRSDTLSFSLHRLAAVRVEGDHIRYRILIRPQPRARPDSLAVSVRAPAGWQFTGTPAGFTVANGAAAWAGTLDSERVLDFVMERSTG